MKSVYALTASLMLVPALSACAGSGDKYPSLAIRDAERVEGSFASASAAAQIEPAPLSADIGERIGQLQAQAAQAHQAFLSAAPGATQLVNAASGAAVASDSWASAQVALADLDSSRSQAAVPLADLDMLYTDATLGFEQREAIGAARDAVTTMIAEEDAILARLRGRLQS